MIPNKISFNFTLVKIPSKERQKLKNFHEGLKHKTENILNLYKNFTAIKN